MEIWKVKSKVNAKPNPVYALFMFSNFTEDIRAIVKMFEKKYGHTPEEVRYPGIYTPEVPEDMKDIMVEDNALLKNTLHVGPITPVVERNFNFDGTE